MGPESKPRRVRFSLLSAVMASVLAAILLWLNIAPRGPLIDLRGWPVAGGYYEGWLITQYDGITSTNSYQRPYTATDAALYWVAPDVAAALVCIAAMVIIIELVYRRRQRNSNPRGDSPFTSRS